MPSYPWQKEEFLFKPSPEALSIFDPNPHQHPLLGVGLRRGDYIWENHLDAQSTSFLADHRIGNKAIMPGAGFVEMLLASARQCLATPDIELRDIDFLQALELGSGASQEVQTRVDLESESIVISSRPRLSADDRMVNAKARFARSPRKEAPSILGPVCQQEDHAPPLGEIYRLSRRFGLNYGLAFQRITACREIDSETIEVELSMAEPETTGGVSEYNLHPVDLDSAFHGLNVVYSKLEFGERKLAYVPVRIGTVRLFEPHVRLRSARIRLQSYSVRALCADFELFAANGRLVATLEDVRFKAANVVHHASMAQSAYHVAGVLNLYDEAAPAPSPPERKWIERLCNELANVSYRRDDDPQVEAALLCEVAARRIAFDVLSDHRNPDGSLSLEAFVGEAEHRLARGLLGRIAEIGLAREVPEGWYLEAESGLPELGDVIREIAQSAQDWIGECALLLRSERQLKHQLNAGGTRGASQDDERPDVKPKTHLDPLYSHSPSAKARVRAVVDAFREVVLTWPPTRPMRVLQIGYAGGALTNALSKLLDRDCASLVVADDDAGALSHLSSTFGHLPHVSGYRLAGGADELDKLKPFDIMVSAGGLEHLDKADARLASLRQHVAANGLALLALQTPDALHDIIFAGQAGWFGDVPGNALPVGRLRTPTAWRRALAAADWTVISPSDGTDGRPGSFELCVAQANQLGTAHVIGLSAKQALENASGRHFAPGARAVEGAIADAAIDLEEKRFQRPILMINAKGLPVGQFSDDVISALRRRGLAVEMAIAIGSAEGPVAKAARRSQALVYFVETSLDAGETTDVAALTAHILQLKAIFAAAEDGKGRVFVIAPGGARAVVGRGTSSPIATAIWSFCRTAINEHANVQIAMIDWSEALEPQARAEGLASLVATPVAAREIVLDRDAYVNLQVRRGLRTIAAPDGPAASATDSEQLQRLATAQYGNLDALCWSGGERRAPEPDEVEIEVAASALNFRDVMWALGLLPEEALEGGFAGPTLGLECSGRVTRVGSNVTDLRAGAAVMALASSAFASHVTVNRCAVAPVPEGVALEAASAIPVAFLTSVYALEHLARLRNGEWVLIHGAAGGVGLAAIQVASAAGARIIATAGTDEKRTLLAMLGADHVLDSRSLSFVDQVRALTGTGGVDVVLNSLAGEAMERSIELLRPFGRFLELGKRDFYSNTKIGLRPFRRNVSYFGIDADQLMNHQPDVALEILERVSRGFVNGEFSALPYRIFESGDVVDAFRFMQKSGHIGKIVVVPPKSRNNESSDAQEFNARATGAHLIVGGTRGFGLEMAAWLAERGAKRVVVTSRSGGDPEQIARAAESVRANGATLEVALCDVTDAAALADLLDRLRRDGPIAGIAHTAMVLEDGVIRNLTRESLERVLSPKVTGAALLDRLTRHDDLDYFILFSSAAALFGNPGQASYVAANGYLDGLARVRAASGSKAIAVAWGAISDVGVLARQNETAASLARHGGYDFSAREGLNLLAVILADAAQHSASANVALAAMNWGMASDVLPIMSTPAYDVMRRHASTGDRSGRNTNLRQAIVGLDDIAARDLVAKYVVAEVASIFRMPAEDINVKRALADLGMDSLMGLELRMAAERDLGVELPLVSISDGTTIHDIAASLLARLRSDALASTDAAEQGGDIVSKHLTEDVGDADVRTLADRVLLEEKKLKQVI